MQIASRIETSNVQRNVMGMEDHECRPNFFATLRCNFNFSSSHASSHSSFLEDSAVVDLTGPSFIGGKFRQLPSVVTWLPVASTARRKAAYACSSTVFESGTHYFEVSSHRLSGKSTPLVGIVEFDESPTQSLHFRGLCIATSPPCDVCKIFGNNALQLPESSGPQQTNGASTTGEQQVRAKR